MTSRRDFLRLGGLLAAGTMSGLAPVIGRAEPIARKGAPVIKVGCAAQSYSRYMKGDKATMNFDDFLNLAAEMGCEGVEMTSYFFPPDFDLAYINKLKRRALVLGLDICATSVGNKFNLPPGPDRDKQLDHVKTWVDHAAEMGAPCMRIFGGGVPKGSTEEQTVKWIEECIHECLPLAEQRGVVLALENHGGVTTDPDTLISIMQSIKSDWLAANLDTANFHTDDPYASIEQVAPYSVTTHMKTSVHPTGKGSEPADVKRIVSILRKVGYRGYLTLEYEASEDPKMAVPRAIAEMKQAAAGS